MINILICDDNSLIVDINKVCIENFSRKINVNSNIFCSTMIDNELEKIYTNTKIDIALLDIDFNNGKEGIALAKKMLQYNPMLILIFITCHAELALDCYNIAAFGFLTKPVNDIKLEQLFNRALIQLCGIRSVKANNRVLKVTSNGVNQILKERTILYIKKIGQVANIYTNTNCIPVYDSLKNLESKLSESFIKINKSALVNKQYIYRIVDDIIIMSDGQELQISKRNIKQVQSVFTDCSNNNLL